MNSLANTNPFSCFPVDVLKHILSYLIDKDVSALTLLSKQCHEMFTNHLLATIQHEEWIKHFTQMAQHHNYQACKLLLHHPTTAYKVDLVFDWTIKNTRPDIVDLFVCHQPSIVHLSSIKEDVFIMLCGKGRTETIRFFLEELKVNPSMKTNWPIGTASQHGRVDIVQLLLEYPSVNPADYDNFPLRMACHFGHLDVVRLLLAQPGVDPTAQNNYAIRMASAFGHTEVVRLLLAQPTVDPTADSNFALRVANEKGYIEVVRLLLEKSSVEIKSKEDKQ